jgi:polysaccharide biosynthesis transport protein
VRQDIHPGEEGSRSSPLFRFLRVLRERWWIIALTTLACTGAALAFSLQQPKEYEASASLLFRNPGFSTALFGSSVFEPSLDPARESTTNLQLVKSRAVASAVRRELGLDTAPDDLLDQVEVEERTNSDVVDVRVRDEDRRLAARLAGEFAQQYVLFRQGADRRKIADAQGLIGERLAQLPPEAIAERDQLEDALQKLVALEAVQTGNAEVIDRAEVPTVAASPQTKRDVAVALIVGLGLGLLVALLLDILDRRVKSSEEFEELYRVPTLVTVPQSTFASRRYRDGGAAFEPFRILYSSLGFLSVSGPMRKVIVTSAIAEEGKTSVAVNLARAVALSGRSVALVEADLRRPSFRRHIASESSPTGLTNALVGRQSATELMTYLHPEDLGVMHGDDGAGVRTDGDVGGLVGVLQSGPVPPNSAELLRSERMAELLEEIGARHDFVIVDAPPLLPVADAQVLLGHGFVDACLIAARVYKTTRDQARRARAILDHAGLERIGLVVSGIRGSAGGYEYYGRIDDTPAYPEAGGRGPRARAS